MNPLERLLRRAAADSEVISFAGGMPCTQTFPRERLVTAAREVLLRPEAEALHYGWPEGQAALRARIIELYSRRGITLPESDVHITNGAQDALSLVLEVLEPRAVHVDALTYPGAHDVFVAHRCVATTESAALRYSTPAISNPHGLRAPEPMRAELLASHWLIEDDAYAELAFDGVRPPPLWTQAPGTVFHIGTLSKTVAPGLRIGWLVAPPQFRERLLERKNQRDLSSAGLTQAMAERLLADGPAFEARLEWLRGFYGERCERLVKSLTTLPGVHFVRPQGGFSVWVETELRLDDHTFLARAISDFNVAFDPGSRFRPPAHQAKAPTCFRLSFSGLAPELYEAGVERLSRLLEASRP